MKTKTRHFRSINGQGLPCKTYVSTTDEGITVIGMVMLVKEIHDYDVLLRKWKNLYFIHRFIAVKKETMSIIMSCISENVIDLGLAQKFPEHFQEIKIPKL